MEIGDDFHREIIQYLSLLTAELQHYFPGTTSCPVPIHHRSFLNGPSRPTFRYRGTRGTDRHVEGSDSKKKQREECSAINFWLSMASSYATPASNTVPQLLIFPSTWECEQEFSVLMNINSKNQNRLSALGHDFRCTISKVMPRIDQLVKD